MKRSAFTRHPKYLLFQIGAIRLARLIGAKDTVVRILAYHSVNDQPDYCPQTINISPTLFNQQLDYLADNYSVISLDDVISCLDDGRSFPENAVVLTFDDGYRDNYLHAFPALKAHGMTATFFVPSSPVVGKTSFWVGWIQRAITRATDLKRLIQHFRVPETVYHGTSGEIQPLIDYISTKINQSNLEQKERLLDEVCEAIGTAPAWREANEDYMLTPAQVREMSDNGMTIGSHSSTHPILSSLSDSEMLRELTESKQVLEEIVEQPVIHFAHPNGPGVVNHSEITAKMIRKAGYRSACISVRGMTDLHADRFLLRRQGVDKAMNRAAFAFKLEEHRFSALLLGS